MTSPLDRAVAAQAEASDPRVCAFVEASAGSGKTKLLTDRLLRLMLDGAPPRGIQCLTFTKAAAAEMALRLQDRLGEWVTMADEALDAKLRALGFTPGPALRDKARALFADVLDLPGGMRIETIHGFCQGLLRRFPLEARISPHFELIEDVAARAEMRAAQDSVLEAARPEDLALVAALRRDQEFGLLLGTLQGLAGRLAPLLALPDPARARLVRLAARAPASEAEAIAAAVGFCDQPLRRAAALMRQHGSQAVSLLGGKIEGWLAMHAAQRAADWQAWVALFFRGDDAPRAPSAFAAKLLHAAHPEVQAACLAEQQRIGAVREQCRAARCAEATIALLRLAAPALARYAQRKQRAGLLDYADLIARSQDLLRDPGAEWVRFKLDGGIDHLLLDEVQDTAPEQWHIAHSLTEEFFAGLGAREAAGQRTIFAVGDPKQSIYSFQGADPGEFDRSRAQMARRVKQAGQEWRDIALDVSFRSTAPVLALVDAVFDDPLAAQGVAVQGRLRHRAAREGAAGRVELWPLLRPPEAAPAPQWAPARENRGLTSAPRRLADRVAGHIAGLLHRGERLESRGRALRPGDVLVLLRRRGSFAPLVVAALKARGVPVAGLDRLVLTEQAAVQDLLAACDAVLLPQDDLAVACVLTSPLGGLSDTALMELALGRAGPLWDTLRARAGERADWGAAWRFLSTLAERADYVAPHALLSEALGRLGGRARLLARLGAEAAEPIDELLNAALAYARLHPPSLQGFTHWLRRSGAEVKREAGGAGEAVRVMTAHGAKGLQAPLVVIPDTVALPRPDEARLSWCAAEGIEVPLWAPLRDLDCAAAAAARDRAQRESVREYNRLLYVALTRAEDRLIVCGWSSARGGDAPAESWYAAIARGFERLGAPSLPEGPDGETVRVLHTAQSAPPRADAEETAEAAAPLPGWAGAEDGWHPTAPPEEPAPLPRPLAPSRPEGVVYGPVPATLSPLLGSDADRFRRGTVVHTLLQHLPDLPEPAREAAMRSYLARSGLDAAAMAALGRQVASVLAHPGLQPLWGPQGRAEQPLTGLVGKMVVAGVVDRMAVLADSVLVADFKTGRAAPARVEETPQRYLRQLAAYRAVLGGLFPGREIRCFLVWTEDATVTALPDALLARHAPGAERPDMA